ncbi:unnamed protein product [Rotaria magnacalcarata]|uniref:Rab proteins geranylgeranyltransferase component A n=2 Tax=Rotaria magnacalcarata TaxID=392030 RepID=A0A818ZJ86_9BILA|nr:unnamed protein product [Rotaria magnacalcarata]CAF1680616.1 unnamed protein product [Rotaria magnacalcarata]CAF2060446.1 unnamed protein product [Rotaria magnacalcarata]CAF2143727.1 unnamed protein product [Rotaria magnacalcarata]CAF2153111.1 unnamed protein product [Rotaria magnacalcarata]
MFDGLPSEYDIIVVGTGIVESILASACARIGKTVLHVDTNEYYGSEWASFPLNGLIEWTQMQENPTTNVDPQDDSEKIMPISSPLNIFRNVQFKWNIEKANEQSSTTENETPKITIDVLEKQSRKFNIDLIPKLYYATGGLIDLLVQSNVGKYCEFKLVSRLLLERNNGQLDNVPSSRSDIFNSNDISLIDKRLLMKVIMNCSSMAIEDLNEDENIPFIDYLKKQKLNDTLSHLIINSISMVDYNATTKEGVVKAKRYLESIGRYGNSPFLYPMYGNGEMSQCFCRLCAVFGGTYFLRFPLAGFTIDSSTNQCSGIVATTRERFRAKDAVICNHAFMDSISSNRNVIHRMVLITNQSIKSSEKDEITYLRLSGPNESGIHIIEVGHGSGCTPDGFFLLYIFQEKSDENLNQVIERLLKLTGEQFTQSNILGQLTFEQVETISSSASSSVLKLLLTHGPDGSINHDSAVNTARTMFYQIYSNGEEFLARAPDPEDIIIEDDGNASNTSTCNTNVEDVNSTLNTDADNDTSNLNTNTDQETS